MLSLSETLGRGQMGQQEFVVSGCRGRMFCVVGSRFITTLGQTLSQLFFVSVRLQSSVCLVISSESPCLYRGLWKSLARPGHFGKGIRGPLAVAGMPDPLQNFREAPPL